MFSFILCFCLHTDKHLADLSLHTSDTQSIHITHTHTRHMYWTSKCFPTVVHFMSGVTNMETNVLFCSKLMFTN
jgi:hypothetical protein